MIRRIPIVRQIVRLMVLMLASSLANAQTPSTESPSPALPQIPTVTLRPAPLLRLPSALNLETGEEMGVDCDSPVEWDEAGNMIAFTSVRHPARSRGRDLFNLESPATPVLIEPREDVSGSQWLEATFRDADGVMYGWYHNEPPISCTDQRLTAPRIGQMISRDDGATWRDQGIILEAPEDSLDCETENFYFAGGNGDFTVMLDRDRQHFYFFFSSYRRQVEEQGVSIARMPYDARHNPAGNVWKWRQGEWTEPGLGGRLTPVFPAAGEPRAIGTAKPPMRSGGLPFITTRNSANTSCCSITRPTAFGHRKACTSVSIATSTTRSDGASRNACRSIPCCKPIRR